MKGDLVDPILASHAGEFAESLNSTLETVLGQSNVPYLKVQTHNDKVLIASQDPSGVQLCVSGQPVYRLEVTFNCTWNSTNQFLAINKSTYQITIDNYPEPVLRFDFLKDAKDVPISHVNIHSHHPGLLEAMSQAKPNSRAQRAGNDTSRLHIPTGGLRFRPTLEDVLEMLIRDFKIDRVDSWKVGLQDGRKNFRDAQLAAAIYDNPDEAVRTLREMGYDISWNDPQLPKPESREDKRGAY